MKAAIIAAGLGERFRAAGVETPKPLVRIAGVPLIGRLLAELAAVGISEAVCIFNEEADEVEAYCRKNSAGVRLRILRRTTASSMESLFALAPLLGPEGRFLLLTVDAVFAPGVLEEFLAAAATRPAADAVLALSDHVDDEKPLFVRMDAEGHLTAIGAGAAGSGVVTAGVYVLDTRVFTEIDAARRAGLGALREWLAHLLARGYRLDGVSVGTTIDVDRPEDVRAAEELVRRWSAG